MGRKPELRQVDAAAAAEGVDRDEFGAFIHEVKSSGERGSRPNGDFTFEELRELAQTMKQERGLD